MINHDRPVRVFKNLKHGCYSILQAGRLVASAREVRLVDVEFRVREAGRVRMLREGRIIVHAFAVGRLIDYVHPDEARGLEALSSRAVHYDPRRFETFVDRLTQAPVHAARLVHLDERGVVYSDAEPEIGPNATELPRAA